MSIRVAFALVLLLASGVISASPSFAKGPYVGLHGGASFVDDVDMSGATFATDTGYAVGGTAGYDFGSARVEGELTYRQNDIDTVKVDSWGTGTTKGEGDISMFSVMANGFYDFRSASSFTPYIGGGFGLVNVSFNDAKTLDTVLIDDDTSVAAGQLAAGFGIKVNESVTVDVGYRFLFTGDVEVTNAFGNKVGEENFLVHTIQAGIRVGF